MKKFALFVFPLLLVFFIFQSFTVFAQRGANAEIRRIDAYCKAIEAFTRKTEAPHLVFADTSDYTENAEPKWRKFASEKALEDFRETGETYTIAFNWRKNGKIVVSNFTLFSPSGDWAKYVHHYFREDGSLAKVESELRTFYGKFIVAQEFYFDRRGALLKKTRRFLDLETQKPKKPGKDDLLDNGDNFTRVEYYVKTDRLPFARLLEKK